MKRYLLMSIALWVTLGAKAQVKNKFLMDVGGGFEGNTFLVPAVTGDENGRRVVNTAFQSVRVVNNFQYKVKNHRFKLYTSGAYNFYQTENPSDSYAYRIKGGYRVKYAGSKYFEFSPELARIDREGLENVNEVLVTLFSYKRIKVPVSFDFYLGDKVWLKTDGGIIYKDYGKLEGERLTYQAQFVKLKLSKKFISPYFETKLSVSSAFHRRNYTSLSNVPNLGEFDEFTLDDDILAEGNLNWNFLFNNIRFKAEDTQKKYVFSAGFHHISRLDQNRRSTYHEFGPSVGFAKQKNRMEYDLRTRYTFRSYPQFTPNDDNRNLRYTYLRLSGVVFYQMDKRIKLFARGELWRRTS
ncbi:MAG: hypothetical protein AAGC47_08720, partial [Bacteroidota bacterium]